MAAQISHLCTCSTPHHQRICGNMVKERSILSCRERAESKEMPSCLSCSVLVSILRLREVQHSLRPSERLFAFLDDLYVVSKPDRVGEIYRTMQESLWAHVGIKIHGGKIHVWNSAGVKPDVCDALQRIAQASDPNAMVWCGSELPPTMQGMKVLDTPLGHPDCVATCLEGNATETCKVAGSIPSAPDVQCAWLLLLHCASTRANG